MKSAAPTPVRLHMTARLARSNRLNGAWWPYTDDITQELGPLLNAVATRVGPARGVMLSHMQWGRTSPGWTPASNPRLRVSWYGHHEPDIAIVIALSGKRLDLLLIPPTASFEHAECAMAMASRDGNRLSGTDTLIAAGVVVPEPVELLAN